jgi:hypothetical protein
MNPSMRANISYTMMSLSAIYSFEVSWAINDWNLFKIVEYAHKRLEILVCFKQKQDGLICVPIISSFKPKF